MERIVASPPPAPASCLLLAWPCYGWRAPVHTHTHTHIHTHARRRKSKGWQLLLSESAWCGRQRSCASELRNWCVAVHGCLHECLVLASARKVLWWKLPMQ